MSIIAWKNVIIWQKDDGKMVKEAGITGAQAENLLQMSCTKFPKSSKS